MKEKIKQYIKTWEKRCYADGIPDEAPARLESLGLVPSYRLICKVILKNENNLELLGFGRIKCAIYNTLKKQELIARGKINCLQTEMF